MATTLPARNEVIPDYTWNAESIFATQKDWETEVDEFLASLPELKAFQGRLTESASILADALNTQEDFMIRGERTYMYAGFSYSVDTTDQNAAAMAGKARSMHGQLAAAASFINPELLAVGEAYGDTVHFNREHLGMTWARFGHLYSEYCVYQYGTGISGAQSLSNRVLSGEPGAVEDYLGFLKSGSSDYPLEVLKKAGVDLTNPEPVEEAFSQMSEYIDRLEKLLK